MIIKRIRITSLTFRKIPFTSGMRIEYKGHIFPIIAVDFYHETLGLLIDDTLTFFPISECKLLANNKSMRRKPWYIVAIPLFILSIALFVLVLFGISFMKKSELSLVEKGFTHRISYGFTSSYIKDFVIKGECVEGVFFREGNKTECGNLKIFPIVKPRK